MRKIHESVVNEATRKVADLLSEVLDTSFYLAGGTALALQLGHRVSLDLDIFSRENPLGKEERASILDSLQRKTRLEILLNQDRTCHLRIDGIHVSLFSYPYPRLEKTTDAWRGLSLAGFRDIAAMKLSAVIGRGAKRDFIDLYFIAREIDLAIILESGEEKFKDHPNFVPQACKALIYFDDAERESLPTMKVRTTWPTIRTYFEKEVPRVVRRLINT